MARGRGKRTKRKRITMITYIAARKLTIYIASNEYWHEQPLASAIVKSCWEHDIAGATVMRCEQGYGGRHVHHTTRLWSANDDLPMRIEIIETIDRFPKVLEALKGMLAKGLAIVTDVQIVKDVPDNPE